MRTAVGGVVAATRVLGGLRRFTPQLAAAELSRQRRGSPRPRASPGFRHRRRVLTCCATHALRVTEPSHALAASHLPTRRD